ncbi:hypothetical protein V2I01_06160 [Micromonospora sp. BRA006-A]|nr:hypothetical protein [Micromonospora sp. BRA006-A]
MGDAVAASALAGGRPQDERDARRGHGGAGRRRAGTHRPAGRRAGRPDRRGPPARPGPLGRRALRHHRP